MGCMGMTLARSSHDDIYATFKAMPFRISYSQGKSRYPHYANEKLMGQRV